MSLDYQPVRHAGDVQWQSLPGGSIRIVVPTRRRTAAARTKFALNVLAAGLPGLILAPVLIPLLWVLHRLLASDKPRAVLSLDRSEFTLIDRGDDFLGWFASTRSWPRADIGELRKNKFDRLLFLRVSGKRSYDLLAGLDDATFDEVVRLLGPAVEATSVPPLARA